MSYEPFHKLVKLTGRAFYDDYTNKGDHNNQLKTGRSDKGMAVVILDALTRRQWVREDDLARDLKLHSKQLRRTLRFFEEEKLVTRDHRKETAKGAKVYSAAVAATADGKPTGGEEKIKLHTHSYCCLDYAQLYDVVRYRLHRMKKKLKDGLESKNTVQEYACPSCHKRYTAFDALQLVSLEDGSFRCESCRSELVAETEKFSADEGDGDDKARKHRREKLKELLEKMEVQLKPLTEQLIRVKDLAPPDYGTLQAWEAKASAARANEDSTTNDSSRSSQGQVYGGTLMSYLGDTKVEVDLSGVVTEDDVKSDMGQPSAKVLPPWMIKTGMNLTDEQRGEIKQEVKTEISEGIDRELELADDKKSSVNEKDEKVSIEDEYVKAYYAAFFKAQQEAAQRQQVEEQQMDNIGPTGPETPTDRRVGVKSKREENESDEDDRWDEEAPPSGQPVTKMYDLNVEATASGEDEDEDDEDIWEEG